MSDFGWNRLAQFDACVQCGRCQEACPAFAAGQPLNPKQLIQDLVRATSATAAGSTLPLIATPDVFGAISPDALWACTTCRACVYECPMLIEHVDAIVDMRRNEVLERGAMPANAAAGLTELRATDTVAGRALDTRLDWAADLALPLIAQTGSAEILLWVGEAGFDRRNQRSLRALVALLRQASVAFAVLGAEELDCGDLARRLGDEVTFQDLGAAQCRDAGALPVRCHFDHGPARAARIAQRVSGVRGPVPGCPPLGIFGQFGGNGTAETDADPTPRMR